MEGYDSEWIEYERAMGKPELPDDIHGRREAFNASLVEMAKQLPPTDPGITTDDETELSGLPPMRIYTPPQTAVSPATWRKRKFPCVVYCHGGGWLSGNLDTEDHMCRTLCAQVPCVVVSVEYKIFPFVTFPAPIEDCFAAFQYVYENAKYLATDPSRITICGGSAGAALAIAVVYRLIAAGQGDRIAGLISMQGMFTYPSKLPEKYRSLHTSYEDNSGPLPIISGDDMKLALEQVAGEEALNDATQFPLHAAPESLEGFPRTYVINTDKEALRDDGTVLEAVLQDLGVPVKRDCMEGLPHYFWCFPVQKRGKEFRDLIVEGAKWVLYPESGS